MTRRISSTRAVTRAVPSLSRYSLRLTIGSLPEPEEAHPEPGGHLGARLVLQGRHLAARDVDLLLQGKPDGRSRPPRGSGPAG